MDELLKMSIVYRSRIESHSELLTWSKLIAGFLSFDDWPRDTPASNFIDGRILVTAYSMRIEPVEKQRDSIILVINMSYK